MFVYFCQFFTIFQLEKKQKKTPHLPPWKINKLTGLSHALWFVEQIEWVSWLTNKLRPSNGESGERTPGWCRRKQPNKRPNTWYMRRDLYVITIFLSGQPPLSKCTHTATSRRMANRRKVVNHCRPYSARIESARGERCKCDTVQISWVYFGPLCVRKQCPLFYFPA